MKLRQRLELCREFPATTGLAALWLAIFLAMQVWQGRAEIDGDAIFGLGQVKVATTHEFGDATARELAGGQAWRAVTSGFIHYSLFHIGVNLFMLLQLGRMVELWYGPGPFLALAIAIGGLGNLLAGAVRPWLAQGIEVHSAGGSTLVLGLIALCAVVGRRSKTRMGDYLSNQMIVLLGFTAVSGLLISSIDNVGHAYGALFGALIGLAHRPLLRLEKLQDQRPAGLLGGAAILILLGSFGAQFAQARTERAAVRRVYAIQERERAAVAIDAVLAAQRVFFNADPAARSVLALVTPKGADGLTLIETTPNSKRRRRIIDPASAAVLRLQLAAEATPGPRLKGDLHALRDLTRSALARKPNAEERARFRSLLDATLHQLEAARTR